jgi:enoyl-[acyl-carrier protein] reductase II
MKRNRICDLLEIEYPLVQGGMLWLANAQLAGAVIETLVAGYRNFINGLV